MRARSWSLMLLGALLAAACQQRVAPPPAAQEPTAESRSYFCGMGVLEHTGPKGQVFLSDRATPLWFGSVRDAVAFTRLPEAPKNLAAVYVNDMARASWDHPEAGTWVEARQAWYVIGSKRDGGMGVPETVPFSARGAAEAFVARWGGRIVAYSDIPDDYVLGGAGGVTQSGSGKAGDGT